VLASLLLYYNTQVLRMQQFFLFAFSIIIFAHTNDIWFVENIQIKNVIMSVFADKNAVFGV